MDWTPGRAPRRKASSCRAGFTLVEVLFAIVVLLIAGVWLTVAYQSALHLAEVSQQTNVALNDLRSMMERIKATPFTTLTAGFPDGAVNGVVGAGPDLYTGIVGGYGLNNEQITVTHSPAVTSDPRELTVQVQWTNRGRLYQRRATTMRSSQAS
jgi:prepilin-type N-terminal cleavage/methylation domain-containing protein